MTTLVVGVGYLGQRLLERLGDGAIGLSRSANRDRRLDLDARDELPITLPGDYAVVYTVPPAAVDTDLPDPRLEHLLSLLSPAPHRLVYLSTTGVYGDRQGDLVTEKTPVEPHSDRALRRAHAERLLEAWCADRRVDLVILRVPGIYGPGRLGVERIRAGSPVIDEADANPGNRIHVDDLARCCVAALSPDAPAGVYNVGDGDERSSTAFTMEVARQLDLPAPPVISREEAERTFSSMRLSFLNESRRVDTTKMRDVLGVTPTYTDASRGIAASIAEGTEP